MRRRGLTPKRCDCKQGQTTDVFQAGTHVYKSRVFQFLLVTKLFSFVISPLLGCLQEMGSEFHNELTHENAADLAPDS